MKNYVIPAFRQWMHDTYDGTDDASPEPAKLICPTTHRVKTAEEVGMPGVSLFLKLGNKPATLVSSRGDEMNDYLVDGESYTLYPDWLVSTTTHSFVQTGCRKSWCSVCDCEGRFDFESGSFKPE